MISKLNVLVIFREHFSTLKRQGVNHVSFTDIFIFYAVPLIIALILFFGCNHRLSSTDGINFLSAMFSIFIGLLLNLLVLIFGVIQACNAKPKSDVTQDNLRRKLLSETFSNISYSILVSFILLVLLFLARVSDGLIRTVSVVIVYTIIGNFLMTLLMVLKRVHALLSVEAHPHS